MSIDRFVVAVGDDDQRRRSGDTTTEDAQHVERRLVRPMHVLEHEHHRLTQLLQQRQRHLARVPAGLDIQSEPSADLHSEIEVRPERRHGQLLAGAEQNAPLNPRDEGAHERRLAHARLATDEQESPALARGHPSAAPTAPPVRSPVASSRLARQLVTPGSPATTRSACAGGRPPGHPGGAAGSSRALDLAAFEFAVHPSFLTVSHAGCAAVDDKPLAGDEAGRGVVTATWRSSEGLLPSPRELSVTRATEQAGMSIYYAIIDNNTRK